MRGALPSLLAVAVGLVLFGPVLVERGERPPLVAQVPAVVDGGAEDRPRRVVVTGPRACFGILRPGTRRLRSGCERIRERRGGVETRLGTVDMPPR